MKIKKQYLNEIIQHELNEVLQENFLASLWNRVAAPVNQWAQRAASRSKGDVETFMKDMSKVSSGGTVAEKTAEFIEQKKESDWKLDSMLDGRPLWDYLSQTAKWTPTGEQRFASWPFGVAGMLSTEERQDAPTWAGTVGSTTDPDNPLIDVTEWFSLGVKGDITDVLLRCMEALSAMNAIQLAIQMRGENAPATPSEYEALGLISRYLMEDTKDKLEHAAEDWSLYFNTTATANSYLAQGDYDGVTSIDQLKDYTGSNEDLIASKKRLNKLEAFNSQISDQDRQKLMRIFNMTEGVLNRVIERVNALRVDLANRGQTDRIQGATGFNPERQASLDAREAEQALAATQGGLTKEALRYVIEEEFQAVLNEMKG